MGAEPLKSHSFLVRYLTLFGGETFSKLCVMAAFAYLARVLSPADYGIVELALAITVFFVLGVESGMGLYGARVAAASPDRIPQLVPAIMLLRTVLALPAFGGILAVAWAYRAEGLGLLAINGLAILLTPFLTQWVFQGLRQMQWVAAGTAARNFTFVLLVIVLVRPGADLRLVAAAEVAGVAVLAVFNARVMRRLGITLDWHELLPNARRLFADVWFMGLSDFTWACLWYSPALVLGWMELENTEQVAWIGAAVRIVLALHTFVFLYFFNLLPNLAKELAAGLAAWRDLMARSIATSTWLAGAVAIVGTLLAPVLIPAVFGEAFISAVHPFQIAVWMVPVAWFSGHFRFSLIAAGQQRWEFAVSTVTAVATVALALLLGRQFGSVGSASSLLGGGIVNLVLAVVVSHRRIASVSLGPAVPAALAAALAGVAGGAVASVAHPVLATIAGALVYGLAGVTVNRSQLVQGLRDWRRGVY